MQRSTNRVCVFCGSSAGGRPEYAAAAERFGTALVARGLGLVYGGGRVGLMGHVADAVLSAGGAVTGVIPRALATRELAHDGLGDLRVVETMHDRKAMMASLSDAFVALPGGFGTLEEFHEVVTWAQLGIHAKPCGVLNVAGFFDPLLALFDRAVDEGFVRARDRALVIAEAEPERLLDRLERFDPPSPPSYRWVAPDET